MALAANRSQVTAGYGEVSEFLSGLNTGEDAALTWRSRRRSADSDEIDYNVLYSEYFQAQKAFMGTANKCLEKLKLPPMELDQASDWNAVQARMEQACSAIEKVSSRDRELLGVTGKMKKAFRGLCKNAGTGKLFTSMIPDDMGGPILSGGLNVMFTALEQTSIHREAVYKALERLPRILNNHVDYVELAHDNPDVHCRTAKLYTEVILTLDHILKWYMTHAFVAGAKRLLNPSALSTNLNDRIAEVNLAAKDLKNRATQIIWRRTQERLQEISTTQKWTAYENVKMGRQLDGIDQNIKRIADRCNSYELIEEVVYHSLPSLLQGIVQKLSHEHTKHAATIANTPVITSEEVLRKMKYDPAVVVNDIEALLLLSLPASMTSIDISRVYALQRSPRVRAWFAVDEPSLLLVNGGATNTLDLSISFGVAKMMGTLVEQAPKPRNGLDVIPLVYFCSQHRNYYRDVGARPTSLAMSLLLQLIEHFPGFKSADLQECLDHTDNKDINSILSTFGRLLKRLPASAVVYLVLDGLSFFNTPRARLEALWEIVDHLIEIQREEHEATLKFMFSSPTKSKYFDSLFEQEEVLNISASPIPMGGPEA